MSGKETTRLPASLDATILHLATENAALEQMYQQSRFEAQCWFFSSLIITIVGTVFMLGTILLLLIFKATAQESDNGRITLIIANVINGGIQHLIIAQARSANRRADQYARELNKEANELHIHELLRIITATLPDGEERNTLLIQTIMSTMTPMNREAQPPLPISALRNHKKLPRQKPDLF